MMKGARVMLTDMQKVTETLTEINANRLYSQMNSKGKGILPYPMIAPSVLPMDWTDFDSFQKLRYLSSK